jgi:hypothetical protein
MGIMARHQENLGVAVWVGFPPAASEWIAEASLDRHALVAVYSFLLVRRFLR